MVREVIAKYNYMQGWQSILFDTDVPITCHYERSNVQMSMKHPVTSNPPLLQLTQLQVSMHTNNTTSIAHKQLYQTQCALYDPPETYTVEQ